MNRKRDFDKDEINTDATCLKSNSILSDVHYFFIHKPEVDTLIKLNSASDRQQYNQIIFERIGIDVADFKMLNIHRIGINVPADFLFDELMKWNSDSCWWPNHIAKVHTLDDHLNQIDIFLFGKMNFQIKKRQNKSPEFHLLRLFNFKLLKKENISNSHGHYLLYQCSGGYPIGVFSLFVRNSIPENDEVCKSQLFMMVSFNFYGIKSLSRIKIVAKTWEKIHNRATANSLNRIKKYCEFNYQNQ